MIQAVLKLRHGNDAQEDFRFAGSHPSFHVATHLFHDYFVQGMTELTATQPLPLTRADDGTIRITGSRVTFDSLIHQFKQGATAEQIHEDFPSLTLRDIYNAIAYYLQHTESVEAYLREQDQATAQTRREMESHQDSSGLRERLRLRRAQCAP